MGLARWRTTDATGTGGPAAAWRAGVGRLPWSHLLGRVAVAAFVVCVVTGLLLLPGYEPSTAAVVDDGPHAPLHGVRMSRALASTLTLSLEVRGGLLVRQLHSWSASVMVAALLLHLLRLFVTGGFRRPRRFGWLALCGVVLLGMGAGLTGVLLPDDMVSGSSLAVLDGLLRSVPVIGTRLSGAVFRGDFPSGAIGTLYPVHVVVLPLAMTALLVVHGVVGAARGPARPRGARWSAPPVGRALRVAVLERGGLRLVVAAVLTAMAATTTVNPVWAYGPADPGDASAGAGALWYLAFLDGAQRLVPPGWEVVVGDRTWTFALLVPVAVSGVLVLSAVVYPFVEDWVAADRREHHVLSRARAMPTRTGLAAAWVTAYAVLWAAAGDDVIALHLGLALEDVVHALRAALLLGPPLAFTLTRRICLGLQRRDRETLTHGYETGRVVRLATGGYVEVHRPVPAAEAWRFADEVVTPVPARRGPDGRIRRRERLRAALARWSARDALPPTAMMTAAADDRELAPGPAAHRSGAPLATAAVEEEGR